MTQADIMAIFIDYVILLGPLLIVVIILYVIFSWIKKLSDTFSGRGW